MMQQPAPRHHPVGQAVVLYYDPAIHSIALTMYADQNTMS